MFTFLLSVEPKIALSSAILKIPGSAAATSVDSSSRVSKIFRLRLLELPPVALLSAITLKALATLGTSRLASAASNSLLADRPNSESESIVSACDIGRTEGV